MLRHTYSPIFVDIESKTEESLAIFKNLKIDFCERLQGKPLKEIA